MRLFITGGTGFIGSALSSALAHHGHEVIVVTRKPSRIYDSSVRYVSWNDGEWQNALGTCEGVVNLAGESIVAKRWGVKQKQVILESRIRTTERLVSAISSLNKRPRVLVSASAVGYYGFCEDEPLTEEAVPGSDFLATICRRWEVEAKQAELLGVRVVRLRMGIVLSRGGGVLSRMLLPFRSFLGGHPGQGNQWVSWIHRNDVIRVTEWILARPDIRGAINVTAPSPVTMRELAKTLGCILKRPAWTSSPAWVLKLFWGEMGDLFLKGQRVLPKVALERGYNFEYPQLRSALEVCFR